MVYLRSSIISALNTNVVSSLVLVRPFCELSIYFLYYKELSQTKGLQSLYDWINGTKGKPPFKNALDYIIAKQVSKHPTLKSALEDDKNIVNDLYSDLSAYNHTPKINESVGKFSGLGPSTIKDIYYVLSCLQQILEILIRLYVLSYPMILYPVSVETKFGFNSPVGIYADKINHEIVKAALGDELIQALSLEFEKDPDVISILEYFKGSKDKNEEEIRKTYNPQSEDDIRAIKEDSLPALLARKKAYMRALSWFMNYTELKESGISI